MTKAPSYVTTKELMGILKVSRDSIVRWRAEGMPFEKINRTVRFNLEEVLKWIEEKTGKERVYFYDKKNSNDYKSLTINITKNQIVFYENIFEIITDVLKSIEGEKYSLNLPELKELLNSAVIEYKKIIMRDFNSNIKLINNNLLEILNEFDLCLFSTDSIKEIIKMLNECINTNFNSLSEDERIKNLIHLNATIVCFNSNYNTLKEINIFKKTQKKVKNNVSDKK